MFLWNGRWLTGKIFLQWDKKKTVGGLCLQMLSVFSCYSLQCEGREWDVQETNEVPIHVARPKSKFSPRCWRFQLLKKEACKSYLDLGYK